MIKLLIREIKSLFTLEGFFIIIYGLLIAIIIRIFSKILLIRIMKINSERIGELIINPAIYLYQRENKINKESIYHFDIFFMKTKPINNQLYRMLKRKINIYPKVIVSPIFEAQKKLSYIFKNSDKYYPMRQRKYKLHYTENLPESKQNISFLENEKNLAEKELYEKFGVSKKDKIACYLIRDQEFLKKLYPNINFDYHEYRNTNPSNFIKSAETLARRGYYVFRMGKFQGGKFNSKNSKIIDYANSKNRSDLLDIYLTSRCTFFLTTMSGLDNLLPIFNIPAIVMPLNLAVARQFNNNLISTRVFIDQEGERVSLKKLFEKNLIFRQKKEDFDLEKIKPQEISPDQINDLVTEMDEHIIQGKPYTVEENKLNDKFWDLYSQYYNEDKNAEQQIKLSGKLKVLSRFDINFLKKNHSWFLN